MIIPISREIPPAEQLQLLSQLGFDTSRLSQVSDYYALTMPQNTPLKCTKHVAESGKETYLIQHDTLFVLSVIKQKMPFGCSIDLVLNESAIKHALSDSSPACYESEVSKHYKELIALTKNGDSSNTDMIKKHLEGLTELADKNPADHAKLSRSFRAKK